MFLDKSKIEEIDHIDDRPSKVYAAARMYASEGFYVLPVRPNTKILPSAEYGIKHSTASKSIRMIDKWFGPSGLFEGWNIGLACGKEDGIFVLDVDNKNGKDGNKALAGFAKPEDIDAPLQITPNNGKHYIFTWPTNGISSTDKLAPGLDTRGGSATTTKSHIVVWPSIVNGLPYKWQIFGEVVAPPEWLVARMGTPFIAPPSRDPSKVGRGNESIMSEDLEDIFPVQEISNMLQYVDPNELSYEEWLAVGQAINTQVPGTEGLQAWDQWSRAGHKYENGECHKRWAGFSPGGPVRIGTLIHFAKSGGYVPPKSTRTNQSNLISQEDEIVEELNKTYGVVMSGGKVAILAEVKDGNPFSPSHQILTQSDFSLLLSNQKVSIADNKGNLKHVPKSAIWLASEKRRTFPGGITFTPGKPKEFDGMYNLWEGYAITPSAVGGNWDIIEHHLKNIICSGNEGHYTWLLDWIADCIQDPANPKGCAVVMRGIEGAGKGTLGQIFSRIFSTHYKHVVHERHLTGNFNAHLANAVVVFADEVLYGGQKKIAGALKALVTERQLTVERKRMDAESYRNCVHLMIASNEDWFIPAGPQSRRWFVLDVNGASANNRKYFDQLHEAIRGDALRRFMRDMLDREITSNLSLAPVTELLLEQRAMSASGDPVVDWWSEIVERGDMAMPLPRTEMPMAWPEFVLRTRMYDAFKLWVKDNRRDYRNGTIHFYKKMVSLGFKESETISNGIKIWSTPDIEDAKKALLFVTGMNMV